MRRNTILLAAALPLTSALSLANFQDITSVLIPISCLRAYDQQIPKCKVADFEQTGCSAACEEQLTQIATAVVRACSNVIVNSNTLLGIVKTGKILGALCPRVDDNGGTLTSVPPQTTATPQTSPPVVATPTKSASVQISTTSTTRQAQSASETSTASQTTSSAVEPVTEPTDTPTAEPTPSPLSTETNRGNAGVTSSFTTSAAAATDTSNVKNKAAGGGQDTGGGSPFDISSSVAPHVSRDPILAIVIAISAGLLISR